MKAIISNHSQNTLWTLTVYVGELGAFCRMRSNSLSELQRWCNRQGIEYTIL